MTAVEVVTQADESLLLRLEEVLPARDRRAAQPRAAAGGEPAAQAADGDPAAERAGAASPEARVEGTAPPAGGGEEEPAGASPSAGGVAPSADGGGAEATARAAGSAGVEAPPAASTAVAASEGAGSARAAANGSAPAAANGHAGEVSHEPDEVLAKELLLKEVLNELARTQGVNAAVVVGRDGFVIDCAHAGEEIDTGAIGAVISAGLGSAEVMGGQLQVGGMTHGMFEYDGGVIIMSLAGEAILAVIADAEANLGMVRHQFRKRCPQVARAM
jgi:predicted regulator of Ras-like GTPase activity (Roadblock/LC7/MglB family)